LGYFFKITTQRKPSPKRRKFAQSGHHVGGQDSRNEFISKFWGKFDEAFAAGISLNKKFCLINQNFLSDSIDIGQNN
jgi:hypothetical protein